MRIYVGSLASSVNDDALRAAFAAHGEVASANVITDRDTGASRGFGFVEMRDAESAKAAMQALDGSELGGSFLKVNEARPRNEGGGNRGGGGGGYGGGGRY